MGELTDWMLSDGPGRNAAYASYPFLTKPFQQVCQRLKLKKKITPRAMRRTFQDLARAAEVKDVVTRAISGHATEQMQRHYSTVNAEEVEASIGKVISLARAREALARQVEIPKYEDEGSVGKGETGGR